MTSSSPHLSRRVLGRLAVAPALAAAAGAVAGRAATALADSASQSVLPTSALLPADEEAQSYVQKYALSCEFAATHIALHLLGKDVPEDAMRTLLGSGEDPDETFRGEIQANQNLINYGTHARAIGKVIELLQGSSLLPKEMATRLLYSLDEVRAALAQGQPVVAWVPLGLRASSRVPVQLSSGKVVNLVYAEHAITLHGYDGDGFAVLDPHTGDPTTYGADALWRGMSLFDDPAIAILPTPPTRPAPTSAFFPETGVTLKGGFFQLYGELGGQPQLGLPVTVERYEIDPQTGAGRQALYTEFARLEWTDRGGFTLGSVGKDYLGDGAQPDPARRLVGDIARFVQAQGGTRRLGPSLTGELMLAPEDALLLPRTMSDPVGQWFQNGLVVWSEKTGAAWGRAGLALARRKGLLNGVAGIQDTAGSLPPPPVTTTTALHHR